MENKELNLEATENEEVAVAEEIVEEVSHEQSLKLMSPMQMVIRRFFRSKLSIIGLVMIIGLFVLAFLGPIVYKLAVPATDVKGSDYTSELKEKSLKDWWQERGWQQDEQDKSGYIEKTVSEFTYVDEVTKQTVVIKQVMNTEKSDMVLLSPSKLHPLGTDRFGYDVLSRLMEGGRTSLIVSFLAIFIITGIGVVAGGLAGYFGGTIDNIIMRFCDILTCLPGLPILMIVGLLLNEWISADTLGDLISSETRIYYLMAFISAISWPGTARLVRGQILTLREQEYMVAAEAMGYSTFRRIFKHLIPNVMPQLIVQMTLGLGSMIIYESSLSYLGFGVQAPNTAWGTILSDLQSELGMAAGLAHPLIWVPAGLCIVIAVLGFNFVGDGLRDALDPKSRR